MLLITLWEINRGKTGELPRWFPGGE